MRVELPLAESDKEREEDEDRREVLADGTRAQNERSVRVRPEVGCRRVGSDPRAVAWPPAMAHGSKSLRTVLPERGQERGRHVVIGIRLRFPEHFFPFWRHACTGCVRRPGPEYRASSDEETEEAKIDTRDRTCSLYKFKMHSEISGSSA